MTRVSFAASALIATLAAAPAAADEVSVVVDQARMLRLDRPATTVVIGNPAIADVTLRDSQTAFLIGRSFGVTNFIVLDAMGQEIANVTLRVTEAASAMMKVSRGNAQFNYSCSPRCELALVPGDAVFEDLVGHVNAKIGQGVGTAGGDE